MQTSTRPPTVPSAGRRAVRGPAIYGELMHGTIPRELERAGAQALLSALFEPGSDRLAHSIGVGRRAEQVARVLGSPDLLVSAAYLHDIGYASAALDTGLHQLDGARYLARLGAPAELTGLVAHHTEATVEAAERGLDDALRREFPEPAPELLDLLTYCDVTTSARGKPVTVDERFERIYDRYPPDHLVSRSMHSAEPRLRRLVSGIDRRLGPPFR